MAMRAHIVLPEELIERVDKIAGRRKRSRFVEEAIEEKLSRKALRVALTKTAGILKPGDNPEWSTPEKTSAWARKIRQQDNERLAQKLAGLEE